MTNQMTFGQIKEAIDTYKEKGYKVRFNGRKLNQESLTINVDEEKKAVIIDGMFEVDYEALNDLN